MRKGVFITFEGLDGAGKTTQCDLLEHWLIAQQIDCVRTREPGGTPLGTAIRQLIMQPPEQISAMALTFLFQADRAQHFRQVVIPALDSGKVVISDRCFDSTIVYQGHLQRVGAGFVEYVSDAATRATYPDLTILLDIPAELVQERKQQATEVNYFDMASLGAHKYIRAKFLEHAKENRNRIKVVDATQDVQIVHNEIVSLLLERFPLAMRGLEEKTSFNDNHIDLK